MSDADDPKGDAGDHIGSPSESGVGDTAMRNRLDSLQHRLDQVSQRKEDAEEKVAANAKGSESHGRALRIGSEFIAGVAVGGFIGYWIDRAFGSSPFGFVFFFLLGMGAGLLNVVRSARQIQEEMPDIDAGSQAVPDDEEQDDR